MKVVTAKAKIFRNNVIIYYKHKDKTLRKATSVTSIENDPKFFKDGLVTGKVIDAIEKNKLITNIKDKINKIIGDYYHINKQYPTVDFVNAELKKEESDAENNEESENKKYETFEVHYLNMLEEKKHDPIRKSSLKDYTSTLNALRLYQYKKSNGKLTLDFMNSEKFYKEFEKFISQKHEKTEFKTQGGLNVNTVIKRISTISTFLRWCVKKNVLKNLYVYETTLERFQPTVVVVNKEEKDDLLRLKLQGDEEKLRDIFVFTCLTGLRYSDILTLHKGHFSTAIGYITKEAQKTGKFFKVPLTKKAIEIIEKYNYRLNFYSTKVFDENIKLLLKKYGICNYIITIKKNVFNEITEVDVYKYNKISSHTGRRSFIASCIITGHNIPEIMAMTGHQNLSSLQMYIDQFQVQKQAIDKIQLLD